MKFFSPIDFFSFGDKIVRSVHIFLLLIDKGLTYITLSTLMTIIVLLIAGLMIGLSSENTGEILIQVMVFTVILILMSASINPLNWFFSHISANYVINRLKDLMVEYIFIFMLILLSATLAKKVTSKQ